MGRSGPKVIHVGYTPANVEQVFFPDAEVVGDVDPSLELLADRLEGKLQRAGALLALREGILARIADRATENRFSPTPQRVVHDVRQVIPEDGIVALDNGMYKIWFARNYRTTVANTLLLDSALATMGAGLPSAMMAVMPHPKRRVLAVCGDGGFMMMTFGNPDFAKYAESYGAKGWRVERTEDLVSTLEAAFAAGSVHLVATSVDYSENKRVLVDELRARVTASKAVYEGCGRFGSPPAGSAGRRVISRLAASSFLYEAPASAGRCREGPLRRGNLRRHSCRAD
jgi:acetolactate synthase-1/2/3 large subunit